MKLFSAALALSSTFFAAVSGQEDGIEPCDGVQDPDLVTKLNFYDSTVVTNTLHEIGGELRYANVGIFEDNTSLDIVVTVIDDEIYNGADDGADYTDIAGVWASRNKGTADELNGRWEDSSFARINLQTVKDKPKSGEGNFRFCIVEHNKPNSVENRVELEEFTWTVYDLDERGKTNDSGIAIREKMLFDVRQASKYNLGVPTEIEVECEDGSVLTDCGNQRTVFKSTVSGKEKDNPTDPNALTAKQRKRAIAFTFKDRACWDFTYDHWCPADQPDWADQPDYDENFSQCRGYTGGNFLFAGDSEELRTKGKCVTPSPVTVPPTPAPIPVTKTEPPVARTEPPTAAPTLPPASCPEDVTIVKTDGVTPIDLDNFIQIIEQPDDAETVKVRLYNSWKTNLGSIFYNYQKDDFDEKCYEVKNVGVTGSFADITIHCYHTKTFATLDICVQDDTLMEGDNATIPPCCNPEFDNIPVACYKVVIECDTVCAEDVQRQRALRGVSPMK